MSRENTEVVSGILTGWAVGDLHAGAADFDEHVVFVVRPDFAEWGVFVGSDGVRRYMHRFLESWEHTTFEAEHLQAVGDTVVVRLVQRGKAKVSGIELELRFFQLFTLRGGKIVRLESVRHEREALEAVGLQE
jgi:ketosteroid isomerase-like protein